MNLPRMFTASYSDFQSAWGVPVRTSVGEPKWWREPLEHVRRLTPYGLLDISDPTAFACRYFEQLDHAGSDALAARFQTLSATHGGRPLVFCCFCSIAKPGVWCHRELLSTWIEDRLGLQVPELSRQPPLLGA